MEIPHDLRSLEAGRPSGTGRPSSLPPSTERTPDRRSDGAGPRSADERSTDAATRRSGANRRTRSVEKSASAEAATPTRERDAAFDEVLEREQASAEKPAAAPKAPAGDAPATTRAGAQTPESARADATPAKRTGAIAEGEPESSALAANAQDELASAAAPVPAPIATHTQTRADAGEGVNALDTHTEAADAIADETPLADADEPLAVAVATDERAAELATNDNTHTALPAIDVATTLEPRGHAETSALHGVAIHAGESSTVRAAPLHTAELAPPPAPPADPARAAEILRQVRLQIVPELKSAVIELAPAELGRVSIELEFDSRAVVARVRAEQPEALSALQRHLPELRASLTRQGIETHRFEFALGFQDGQRGREANHGSRRTPRITTTTEATTSVVRGAAPLARAIAAGGVDTYA